MILCLEEELASSNEDQFILVKEVIQRSYIGQSKIPTKDAFIHIVNPRA